MPLGCKNPESLFLKSEEEQPGFKCFAQVTIKSAIFTLKYKRFLIGINGSMKNLNIHGTLQMQKRFFIVEKGPLDF